MRPAQVEQLGGLDVLTLLKRKELRAYLARQGRNQIDRNNANAQTLLKETK
jgi:hypothetical protein